LGGRTAAESYLDVAKLIDAAARSGAEAVHPGYGFLAESARFARAVADAGLVWIGPPPEAIEVMGLKTAARARMRAAGVPVVPGSEGTLDSAEEVAALGERIGYPLLIKAAAGGGGKGMRVVESADEVAAAFEGARREGGAYFADSSVYAERYLADPRHVEVQVLADGHGNVIHLGERDCTIQRRHQKLVEETPSPAVTPELRERIGAIAVDAARAVGYRSAGTIEGLLSPEGEYFFLEMNTRIQVEHTVTELVTGLDLVREQVLIAAGEPLSLRQEDVVLRGHAIECRINAEDPSNGFLPSPGRITSYREPAGPGVRVDSGVAAGSEVSDLYDPMLAKLIVHDVDRERARGRMLRALSEYEIGGIETLLGFHQALLSHPCFAAGETCHGLVESEELAQAAKEFSHEATKVPRASDGSLSTKTTIVEVDGRRVEVKVSRPEPPYRELARRRRERVNARGGAGGADAVVSPMQGTVLEVHVAEGDEVEAGAVICIVEAMKMENEVTAHRPGVVTDLAVTAGGSVGTGQTICLVVPRD
ncbi:MAG: ATP-grasp domain-containing protein, partial [Actinobacteria bacterium]|nr:ATP-grasp domain-containing protein [Actinomycetota bacterium]